MTKPQVTDHRVISFLTEEQLAAMSQSDVHFTILVYVWRIAEASRHAVQVEDGTFADIHEKTNVALAPKTEDSG